MDVRSALMSQIHAALAMLRQAIERCPESLWTSETPTNRFWQVAYHALFYAHLYAMPGESAFEPWEKHREEHQFLGRLPWPPHDPPRIGEPYTRSELLEYADHVGGLVDGAIDRADLDAEDCGFWWYSMPKLDHLILGIRHAQHHAGQLADRLRNEAGIGVGWVGGGL